MKDLPTSRLGRGVLAVATLATGATLVHGCIVLTRIGVNIECPETLAVGQPLELAANETNPGAIARYLWSVSPASAGTFNNPSSTTVTFQPLVEGQITILLEANDGLFQAIDSCMIEVAGMLPLAVSLEADPDEAFIDEEVTLTCTSIGEDPIETFTVTQTGGRRVDLTEIDPGVFVFTTERTGMLTFRCVGSAGEEESLPATTTVRVIQEPAENMNANANDNANGNTNANANNNDNEEITPPPDNSNENAG